jgi:hypothetical protein
MPDPQDRSAKPGEAASDPEASARGRLSRLARRLMDRDLSEDARDLVGAVLETSNQAKSELVRMTAREIRGYLEELKLKEDLMSLVSSHSLEIHLSFSLKPLEGARDPKGNPP